MRTMQATVFCVLSLAALLAVADDALPTGNVTVVTGAVVDVTGQLAAATGEVSAVASEVAVATGDVATVTGEEASATGEVSMVAAMVEKAAEKARQDAEASVKELSALRDAIAGEKVPMAKELSRLEEQLAASRKDYDKVRRTVDQIHLDQNNLKAEIKQHQDELSYVGNLFDEYARSFEGRVHVSEMQRYGPTVEAALQAPQNKDLSMAEKFSQQCGLVEASIGRIEGLIGGVRFSGNAVDPQGIVETGKFALIGPVALFSADSGAVAGLALPQTGSSKPAVRPLEPALSASMAAIVATGKGLLPLDPTRGDALKALIARGSLWGYFKKGGPIMWPLLFLSMLAVTVILERVAFLVLEGKRRSPKTVRAIMGAIEKRDVEGAIRAGCGSKDYLARCLSYALEHREMSLSNALMRSTAIELYRYNRGIGILDTIITMAPLLGLLGTVTGMIGAFGMLGGGDLGAPTAITGGIAEALIATTFGLGIAITTLIPLSYLHSRCEQARHELEDAATHMELLMKPIMDAEGLLHLDNASGEALGNTAGNAESGAGTGRQT